MAENPKSINIQRVEDTIAVANPAEFIQKVAEGLPLHADRIVHRMYTILTSDTTSDAMFLKAWKSLNDLLCMTDMVKLFLALRGKGRPGDEEDEETTERRKRWADVLDRYPDVAAKVEALDDAPVDASFEVTDPPPRRGD